MPIPTAPPANPPSAPPVPVAPWLDGQGRPTPEFQRFLRDLMDWAAAAQAWMAAAQSYIS